MRQAGRILLINDSPIVWIKPLHFGLQPFQTLFLIRLLHLLANGGRHERQVIQTLADRIGI